MLKQIKLLVFIIITVLTIMYLSSHINSYDMRFYFGKDNGYLARSVSICILSSIFWTIMHEHNRIKYCVIGFLIGIFSSGLAYFALISFQDNATTQLVFHILACVIFMAFYFLKKRIL